MGTSKIRRRAEVQRAEKKNMVPVPTQRNIARESSSSTLRVLPEETSGELNQRDWRNGVEQARMGKRFAFGLDRRRGQSKC